MVVNAGDWRWETVSRFFPGPVLIRTIGVDGGVVARRHGVRMQENKIVDEKLEPARHDIRIYAKNLVSERPQNPGQRNLGANAITVGPRMTDDGQFFASQSRQQLLKTLRNFWKEFLHA